MITSIFIDSKEPKNIQALDFGVPSVVTNLEAGDLWAATQDSQILIIERKTLDDLLSSLQDGRLFTQAAKMVEMRGGIYFPYIVITGPLTCTKDGKVITARGITGWNYDSVMGGLLTVQEMGMPVVHCRENDYVDAVIRLGKRSRGEVAVTPARPTKSLGEGAAVLLALPGIGPEMLNVIWKETNGVTAHALMLLSDPEVESKVPKGTRQRVRKALGLSESLVMSIDENGKGQEILKTYEMEAK
jgi:ERCC4-type nuclease